MSIKLHQLGISAVAIALSWGTLLSATSPAQTVNRQLDIRPTYETRGQPRDLADELMQLGNQKNALGQYEQAITAWYYAIDIYHELGDLAAIGQAYDYIGLTYAKLGQYTEAEDSLRRRLSIARDNRDVQGQIYGWNNLGTIFIQSGNIQSAQTSFQEGLEAAQSVDNYTGIGLSLSNLALAAMSQRNYTEAAKLYEAAANYRYLGGDLIGEANSSISLGHVYRTLGRNPQALGAYQLGYDAARSGGDQRLQLRAIDGLIATYWETDNLERVRAWLDQRVAITSNTDNLPEELISARRLGEYSEAVGDLDAAHDYYVRALELAQTLGDKPMVGYLSNRILGLANRS